MILLYLGILMNRTKLPRERFARERGLNILVVEHMISKKLD